MTQEPATSTHTTAELADFLVAMAQDFEQIAARLEHTISAERSPDTLRLAAARLRELGADDQFTEKLKRLVRITTDIFGDGMIISEKHDPEISGYSVVELSVQSTRSVDWIVNAHDKWHRRLVNELPRCSNIVLSVDPISPAALQQPEPQQ